LAVKECTHPPHTVRITFDVGNGETKIYDLCKSCKEFPIFQKDVISEEIIP